MTNSEYEFFYYLKFHLLLSDDEIGKVTFLAKNILIENKKNRKRPNTTTTIRKML